MRYLWIVFITSVSGTLLAAGPPFSHEGQEPSTTTLRGKIMCGYQGWFRCPGDACGLGWIHYSRDWRRITPQTLTFEMWPAMRELGPDERFTAPGFTYPDGTQAELFASDNPRTVLRHFQWMRQYGIDGAWLQHFLVDLPGGIQEKRYASRAACSATWRRPPEKPAACGPCRLT